MHRARPRQKRLQKPLGRRGDRTQPAGQGRPADPEQTAELEAILARLPRVSREEIEACRTPAGGYSFTRERLAAWGVPWPPPAGWRQALLRGEDVSDAS